MLTIELRNLRFHAYHGLYAEEKLSGAEFEVNVTVTHHPQTIPVMHLDETVDYTAIYQLIKNQMQLPTALLETLVTKIADEILTKFSQVEEVKVAVTKMHPPIIAFQGSVGVSYVLKRNA